MKIRTMIYIITGLLVGALIVGGVLFFLSGNKDKSIQQAIQPVSLSPTPTLVPLTAYENPSGFAFDYPETAEITDREDKASYANITLSSPDTSGSISFQVTDTKLKSADAWIKDNDIDTKEGTVDTIAFADIEATQVATDGGIVTVSFDEGALFILRVDWENDRQFWQIAYDSIISTFAFIAPSTAPAASSPSSSGSTGSDIIFEGEEIIE